LGVNVQSSYEIGTQRRRLSSKNALARAIQYALSRWEALTRYAGDAGAALNSDASPAGLIS